MPRMRMGWRIGGAVMGHFIPHAGDSRLARVICYQLPRVAGRATLPPRHCDRHKGVELKLHVPCHTTRRAGPHRAVRWIEARRGTPNLSKRRVRRAIWDPLAQLYPPPATVAAN